MVFLQKWGEDGERARLNKKRVMDINP